MSSSLLEDLPEKGVYTLVIQIRTLSDIAVSKLGVFTFHKGYYAYTGSAMNNLRKRVERHMKNSKIEHWHIDFLLNNDHTELLGVIASSARQNIECKVNKALFAIVGTSIPAVGFGASDCRCGCKSHLVYFGERNPWKRILKAYRASFGSSAREAFMQMPGN